MMASTEWENEKTGYRGYTQISFNNISSEMGIKYSAEG